MNFGCVVARGGPLGGANAAGRGVVVVGVAGESLGATEGGCLRWRGSRRRRPRSCRASGTRVCGRTGPDDALGALDGGVGGGETVEGGGEATEEREGVAGVGGGGELAVVIVSIGGGSCAARGVVLADGCGGCCGCASGGARGARLTTMLLVRRGAVARLWKNEIFAEAGVALRGGICFGRFVVGGGLYWRFKTRYYSSSL